MSDRHCTRDGHGTPGGHAGDHQQHVPPSAAGHLEPYGARVSLRAEASGFDPQPFLVEFLGGLATGCMDAGATVIGHLKCFLRLPGGGVACNLTSLRAGATCTARGVATPVTLPSGLPVRLDLAVLVYGLPEKKIDALVRAELSRTLATGGVSWSLDDEGDDVASSLADQRLVEKGLAFLPMQMLVSRLRGYPLLAGRRRVWPWQRGQGPSIIVVLRDKEW